MTGCAGFIGSHLIETLLKLNQKVVGLDNFATGHRQNLNLVRKAVGETAWKRFHFVRGDIRKINDCYKAFGLKMPKLGGSLKITKITANRPRHTAHSVDIVLHQAALGSVPRSIKDPLSTHEVNVTGFMNMLIATRDAGVRRFVYASSSSVYGDSPVLPKREDRIGKQLSPYAVSKYTNELYAGVFGKCYGLETIGLRYFNVFGPRQDPNGPYAAVIPRWKSAIEKSESVVIYGDGKTSRDFCYVDNAVQANLLAGLTKNNEALNQAYNIACGAQTSLHKLYSMIVTSFARTQHLANSTKRITKTAGVGSAQLRGKNCQLHGARFETKTIHPPRFLPERAGDIRHSLADISKALDRMGYAPSYSLKTGLEACTDWYLRDH